jgi:hypothetical protein
MKLYEYIFINGLPVTILVIVLAQLIFRPFGFKKSVKWTKYLIIVQGILTIFFLIKSFFDYQNSELIQRMTGEYGIIYAVMIMTNIIFPILIIVKPQLGNKIWLLFSISVLLNFGWIMESFVTIIASLHRDYETFFPIKQIETISKGIIIGVSMLLIDYLTQTDKFDIVRKGKVNKFNLIPLITLILILTAYFLGVWLSSIYGFDPPYGLFYLGLILKAFSLSLGLFLIVFYLESGVKILKRKK